MSFFSRHTSSEVEQRLQTHIRKVYTNTKHQSHTQETSRTIKLHSCSDFTHSSYTDKNDAYGQCLPKASSLCDEFDDVWLSSRFRRGFLLVIVFLHSFLRLFNPLLLATRRLFAAPTPKQPQQRVFVPLSACQIWAVATFLGTHFFPFLLESFFSPATHLGHVAFVRRNETLCKLLMLSRASLLVASPCTVMRVPFTVRAKQDAAGEPFTARITFFVPHAAPRAGE